MILVFLVKTGEGALASVFRQRGDKGGQKDRYGDPCRLDPIRRSKHEDQIDHEGGDQNFDHGIVQIFDKMRHKA